MEEVFLMDLNNETGSTKLDALSKISRRADDIKTALKEVQARKRAQERADKERLEALIGSALLTDAEADTASAGGRRAYISQALDRQISSAPARAFLSTKGWL
jgi:hypothetical protein